MGWGAAIGGIAGGLLGGASGNEKTTKTAKPWMKQSRRGLRFGVNEARDIYGRPIEYYPGEMTAALAPEQIAANQYLTGLAGQVQPYIGQARATSSFMQDPRMMLDVASNPYVAGQAGALENQAGRFFRRNVMPGIRRGSSAAGQFGGSRGDIATGLAAGEVGGRLADATANLFGGAYGQGLQAMGQAQSIAPNIMQMGAYPGQLMQQVGQQYRDYDQSRINDAVNRFNFYQQEPENRLDRYLNRQMGVAGLGGINTSQGGGPNTLSRVVGGAMMGADLGGRVGGLFGNQSFNNLSPNQWLAFNTPQTGGLFGSNVRNMSPSLYNFGA